MKGIVLVAALVVLLVGCASGGLMESPMPSPIETLKPSEEATSTSPAGGLPNPASKYCVDQGYRLEIRSDEAGNQYGVCIFPDGSECEEWAFFRGECTYQEE
jgi:putative hemolysin